jgi:hypothetical protein
MQTERDWFRVEISDHKGQVVAIETEMLAGRDIGDEERDVINRAIDHLAGFVGRPAVPAADVRAEALEEAAKWIDARAAELFSEANAWTNQGCPHASERARIRGGQASSDAAAIRALKQGAG